MNTDEFVLDLFTRFDAGDVGVQTGCIQDLNQRLTATDALAELAAEFVEDKQKRVLRPKCVSRHVVPIYTCQFCGAADTANLDHADDCLYARTRKALHEYREAADND